MTAFTDDLFKLYNSYYLHLKYPSNSAEQNWLDSCEILNRIYQGKSYIQIPGGLTGNKTIKSTHKWIDNFCVEIESHKIIVRTESRYIENSLILGNFSFPWELPSSNHKYEESVINDSSLLPLPYQHYQKKLVLKN